MIPVNCYEERVKCIMTIIVNNSKAHALALVIAFIIKERVT